MARKRKEPPAKPFDGVVLRTPDQNFELSSNAPAQLSSYWSHVVQSRFRWQEDQRASKDLIDAMLEEFRVLGLGQSALASIAYAGIVEVSIPYPSEDSGWQPHILPWEFLLSEATRNHRLVPLDVIRHLRTAREMSGRGIPKRALFVENGAGAIGDLYSFEEEGRWMESQLGLPLTHVSCPTLGDLALEVAEHKPDIVHLSGIDVHQGRRLGFIQRSQPGVDGLLMAGSGRRLDQVLAPDLAQALNASRSPPKLLAFNFQYSAGSLATEAINAGAQAAIGFQDQVDDELAERFYAAFYREWRSRRWDLLAGFRAGIESLRKQDALRSSGPRETEALWGSGIVLWSDASLIHAPKQATKPLETRKTSSRLKRPRHWREILEVRVQAPQTLNYSLMHSGERLFKTFTLYRKGPGELPPINVKVVLHTGTDSFPFETTVRMDANVHDLPLAHSIHLPLTSRALRALRETVRSGLFYRVTCDGEEIACETAPITLCPIDEWRMDSVDDARWLGAFVLPRDPAVLAIVDLAQKYLYALQDDSGAGFDGYQSMDPELEDPDIGVEVQVRALWCALAFEMNIAYVNPPPVFTEQSQRLRSPREVIGGKRGTCIDLALMFAACLEYIEIYPVVFVLKDHAFPGFWRSEEAYQRFIGMKAPQGEVDPNAVQRVTTSGFTTHEDVLRHVRSGDLVPIETVALTRRLPFHEAVEQGMENLKDRDNFGNLLDVRRERRTIAPLPMLGGEA